MLEKIFVGSSTETLSVAEQLKQQLSQSSEVTVWTDGVFKPGSYFLDSLVQAGDIYDFFVLLALDDDRVVTRGKQHFAPRDNLIFELGLFLGKVRKERVILVTDRGRPIKLPSDIAGIQVLRLDFAGKLEEEIATVAQEILSAVSTLGRRNRRIEGKRLFKYTDRYPIDLVDGRKPAFVKSRFLNALKYFVHDAYDELAATDLAYLYLSNLSDFDSTQRLNEAEKLLFKQLEERYRLRRFMSEVALEHEELFGNYKRILEDIGRMLKGVHFEAILHDIRNPLGSIIVAANSDEVSRRKIGDPSTRFVVQFVKDQGEQLLDAMNSGSKVCYLKQFEKDKKLKAATTPIWHDRYGLIGIVCFNIDIDAVDALPGRNQVSKQVDELLRNLTRNSGSTPSFELDMFE
ncbi:TIR domain-containing protein [uncultured Roseobacter sp.]|uniref:TIR domain-containing protein n=1 Tax=uncultured Roseobacter sp. TaxID=114847 RepID=UPI00262AE85F|nr:TIR domain-containing protein [uncultured Roseobacter sp.]